MTDYEGIIPEGSTIKIVINGDPNIAEDCIALNDTRMEKHSLMLMYRNKGTLGSPVTIDSVEKVNGNVFILHAWWQDCLVIKGNTLFSSYSDAID